MNAYVKCSSYVYQTRLAYLCVRCERNGKDNLCACFGPWWVQPLPCQEAVWILMTGQLHKDGCDGDEYPLVVHAECLENEDCDYSDCKVVATEMSEVLKVDKARHAALICVALQKEEMNSLQTATGTDRIYLWFIHFLLPSLLSESHEFLALSSSLCVFNPAGMTYSSETQLDVI